MSRLPTIPAQRTKSPSVKPQHTPDEDVFTQLADALQQTIPDDRCSEIVLTIRERDSEDIRRWPEVEPSKATLKFWTCGCVLLLLRPGLSTASQLAMIQWATSKLQGLLQEDGSFCRTPKLTLLPGGAR